MKIKKFNEHSSYTIEDLIKYQNKKNENIFLILKEYLILNSEELLRSSIDYDDYDDIFFITSYKIYDIKIDRKCVDIEYSTIDGNTWQSSIYDEQFQDLLIFLDNPESYKNSRKYNI